MHSSTGLIRLRFRPQSRRIGRSFISSHQLARSAIAIRLTYGEASYIAAVVILSRSPDDAAGIGYLRTAAGLGFQPAIKQLEAIAPRP